MFFKYLWQSLTPVINIDLREWSDPGLYSQCLGDDSYKPGGRLPLLSAKTTVKKLTKLI